VKLIFSELSLTFRMSNNKCVNIFRFYYACYMSRAFQFTLFDNRNDIWCKGCPTVFEHSECRFKIHSRHGCISKFMFFFYVMFFSVLCRSWGNQIPVQGVCQWPTRFIVSHVNSKLQKGGRTKIQRSDARVTQFYKASYDICPLRCECCPPSTSSNHSDYGLLGSHHSL